MRKQRCAVGQRRKSAEPQSRTSPRQSEPPPRLGCSLPVAGSHRATDSAASITMLTYSHNTDRGGVVFHGKALLSFQTPFYKSEVCPLHPTC